MDTAQRAGRLMALIPLRGRRRGRLLVTVAVAAVLFEIVMVIGAGDRPAAVQAAPVASAAAG
jgi:hypothetical protein